MGSTLRKMVDLRMYVKSTPVSERIILRFYRALRTWISRSCEMSSPVLGSSPTCPETYMVPLKTLTVEYGPIALGP